MKKIVPDPPLSLASPVIQLHLSAREALVCADTLLKDIYETTESYRAHHPGESAESLDAVMDSTLIAAALLAHAVNKL